LSSVDVTHELEELSFYWKLAGWHIKWMCVFFLSSVGLRERSLMKNILYGERIKQCEEMLAMEWLLLATVIEKIIYHITHEESLIIEWNKLILYTTHRF
jgi:hypothetical protein